MLAIYHTSRLLILRSVPKSEKYPGILHLVVYQAILALLPKCCPVEIESCSESSLSETRLADFRLFCYLNDSVTPCQTFNP